MRVRWPWQHKKRQAIANIASVPQQLAGVQLQTSAYGMAIPIVYGQARLPGILLHYKVLSGNPNNAAILIAISEGPIRGINYAWVDKAQYSWAALVGLGIISALGTSSQTAWSYLTANFPAEAVPYQLTAYVANAAWPLSAGSLGNFSWEVLGLLPQGGGILDSNPKDVVSDFLTNADHGALFPSSLLASLTQFGVYCQAAGLFISPAFTTQQMAAEHLTQVLASANSAFVWSDGQLKVIPYGDTVITGNGVTFTPNVTPVYDLTDDDFLADDGEDPVKVSRKPQEDSYNHVRVEFDNRSRNYSGDIAEAKDQASIEATGLRPSPIIKAPFVKDPAVARTIAQLSMQRSLYIRNTYEFKLGWKYALLEPMDLVTLTDANLGLSLTPVRLLSVEEDDSGELSCTAEEWPSGVATATLYPSTTGTGYTPNAPELPYPPAGAVSFDATGQAILNSTGDPSTVKQIWVIRTDRLPSTAEIRAGTVVNANSIASLATAVVVAPGAQVFVGIFAYNASGAESGTPYLGAFEREGPGAAAAPTCDVTVGDSSGLRLVPVALSYLPGAGGSSNYTYTLYKQINSWGTPIVEATGSQSSNALPRTLNEPQQLKNPTFFKLVATDTVTGLSCEAAGMLPPIISGVEGGAAGSGATAESQVRSGAAGGYSSPGDGYATAPVYDKPGLNLLIDPVNKLVKQALGLDSRYQMPSDVAVKNSGATASFGANRHNDEQQAATGASKTFGVSFDNIPQMRAIPQSIRVFVAASSGVDQKLDVRPTSVSVAGYTARAKIITGGSSAAHFDYFAATLNGTPNPSGIAMSASGDAAYCDLASANTTLTTYIATFDVDTTSMLATNTLYVSVYVNNGTGSTSWTLVGSASYGNGLSLTGETISFAAAMALDWDVRIVISYQNPAGVLVRATVTAQRTDYSVITGTTEVSATPDPADAVLFQAMEAP